MEELQNSYSEQEPQPKRKSAKRGDIVTISYTSTIDGETYQGADAENINVEIGAGSAPKDFEDQLIGISKDEESEISVKYPEDMSNPTLAGKEVAYKVNLTEISKKILPELDDELSLIHI